MSRFFFIPQALCLTLFLCSAAFSISLTPPNVTPQIYTKEKQARLSVIRRLIDSQSWKVLIRQVQDGLKSKEFISLDLERIGLEMPTSPFGRAVQATHEIMALPEQPGMHYNTVFPISLFAETLLAGEIVKGKHFWDAKYFGREMQYDPETKRFFIHMGNKGKAFLGEGRKKIVTKTVLYDHLVPEVMARGLTSWDVNKEMDAMRKLKGLPGLLQAEALMKHRDPKTKKRLSTIVTKIYRPGSLQDVFDKRSIVLTTKQRLQIAYDIITGIASMQEHGYVHRDLGARNYFVSILGRRPFQKVRAVVADMGRTIPVSKAVDVPVQGNSSYIAPEGFFRSKMKGSDYFASDLFALGSVFWELHHRKPAPWRQARLYKQASIPLKQRYALYVSMIKKARETPLKSLKRKRSKPLSVKEKFLSLVLQMTDPNPAKRGNAAALKNEFRALLARA